MNILGKKNSGVIFFKTVVNIDDETVRYLHIIPDFNKNLVSYFYEIHGSDGTRYEADVNCRRNNVGVISFRARLCQTYFIKIISNYGNNSVNEFFSFYKMDDNFEDEEEEEDEEGESEEKSTKSEEIENINVEKEEESEENKITRYFSSRTPNSGLEIDNEIDLDLL